MQKIITLTTDFGITDEYAGTMKGVLLSDCDNAHLVDITHGIRSHDIRQAAYVTYSAHRFFKPGTIHVVVVDPGVGTKRRIILAKANNHFFLAPDNGVLSLFSAKKLITACYSVECHELFLKPLSHTFHGRDIMAPVAAALACGMPENNVGPEIDNATLTVLPLPQPTFDSEQKKLTGAIVDFDHFGNLTTNIHLNDFNPFFPSPADMRTLCIQIRNTSIQGISQSYAAIAPGKILALFGSRDYLEIAANQESALKILGVSLDDPVTLRVLSKNC